MGFLSWLTSGSKAAENVTETGKTITTGIVNGIDALWFTDEEKAQASQKGVETILEFWKAKAGESTDQSRARRDLAIMTFKVFFSMLLLAIAVYKFDPDYAKFILEIAGSITFIVSAITVIYFGPHQISKIFNWKKNGKSEKG